MQQPLQIFYRNRSEFGFEVNFGNNVKVSNKVMSEPLPYRRMVSLFVVVLQNVIQHSGEGGFILLNMIPVSAMERRQYPCIRSLLESRMALILKHS